MNSLEELNGFSSLATSYGEELGTFLITFDRPTPTNQSISINEGQTHTLPVGINITEARAIPEGQTITYTINLHNCPGATLNWPFPFPSTNLTVTNPSADVYLVTGISGVISWDAVKSPTVILPKDYTGTFTYTCTIAYPGPGTKSWTTTVAVANLGEITAPTSFTYDEDVARIIAGYPQITDVESDGSGIYNVTITPSNVQAISSITTTTSTDFTFNASTKVTSITGTRLMVNQTLADLHLIPGAFFQSNFVLTYVLTNPVSGLQTTVTQNALIGNTHPDVTYPTTITYNEGDINLVNGGYPQIFDAPDFGTVTVTVTPKYLGGVTISGFTAISTAGTGGSSTYDANASVLTISGTITQVNTHLATMTFTPGQDLGENFEFAYNMTSSTSPLNVTFTQSVNVVDTDQEVINMNYGRTYDINGYELLFPTNVPQIDDNDNNNSQYMIRLSLDGDVGVITHGNNFASPDGWYAPTRTWTYGPTTKAACNAIFSSIRFLAGKDITSAVNVTYQQYRNDVLTTTKNFTLSVGNANKMTGYTGVNINEDSTTSALGLFTIRPHYSESYGVALQLLPATSTLPAKWITDGWNTSNTTYTGDTTYKNYGPSTTATELEAKIAELNAVTLRMSPDYITAFALLQRVGFGGSYNGAGFTAGSDVRETSKGITVVADNGEFNISTISYTEDTLTSALNYQILDQYETLATYTTTFTCTAPFSKLGGRWKLNNTNLDLASPLVLTGTKAQVNANAIRLIPPTDYAGTITINMVQQKVRDGITTTQVDYTFEIPCTSSHAEYSLTVPGSTTEDTAVTITHDVTDLDANYTRSWNVKFTQLTPNPATNPGIFYVNGSPLAAGTGVNVSSSNKTTINAYTYSYLPPTDYAGTVTLGFYQAKTVTADLGQTFTIVQADTSFDIAVSNTSDYSIGTSTYAEDTKERILYTITDTDPLATQYTATFTFTNSVANNQQSRFWSNTTAQAFAVNPSFTITGTKAQINNTQIYFDPPPDYTQTLNFTLTQSKVTNGVTKSQGTFNFSMLNRSISTEYAASGSNYYEDTPFTVLAHVVDVDTRADYYTQTYRQIYPDPAQYPEWAGRFVVGNSVGAWGQPLTVQQTKANASVDTCVFEPPKDYWGYIRIWYDQTKHIPGFSGSDGNISQALNAEMLYQSNLASTTSATIASTVEVDYLMPSKSFSDIITITDPAPTETHASYSVNVALVGNLGTVGTLQYGGNSVSSVNLTGTKTQVINQLANLTYVHSANITSHEWLTADVTKTISSGSYTVASGTIYANVAPHVGSLWTSEGGTYVGTVAANVGLGDPNPTHYVIADYAAYPYYLTSFFYPWTYSSTTSVPKLSSNVLFDPIVGTVSSQTLNSRFANNMIASGRSMSARFAEEHVSGIHSDYHLPSYTEAQLVYAGMTANTSLRTHTVSGILVNGQPVIENRYGNVIWTSSTITANSKYYLRTVKSGAEYLLDGSTVYDANNVAGGAGGLYHTMLTQQPYSNTAAYGGSVVPVRLKPIA